MGHTLQMLFRGQSVALVVGCLVFACDNTPDKLGGVGGSGGNSGAAGSSGGSAGSSGGSAGSGGTSGSAGSGGGGGSGGASGSAGSSGSAGTSGAAGADAGPDGSAGADAGSGGSAGADGGSAACNYLTQIGVQVTAVPSGGGPPAPSGGTIAEGFYKLVGVNLYGGATGTTFWRSLRFVGNELKTVERDGGKPTDITSAGTYVAAGGEITRSITCPNVASAKLGFTAKPTSFTAYVDQGSGKIAEFVYQWDSK